MSLNMKEKLALNKERGGSAERRAFKFENEAKESISPPSYLPQIETHSHHKRVDFNLAP